MFSCINWFNKIVAGTSLHMCVALLIRTRAMWQLQIHLKMDLGERAAQWKKCYLSKCPHLLYHGEIPQPLAACCAFMPRCHFCFCSSWGQSLTTDKVKGLVGHHHVLSTAAGIVERPGFAYWCTRFIHLLEAVSSVSAGFEDLPVVLVSFLWHLSFSGSMRNSIQIFFFLVRSFAHMHT